MYSLQTTVLKTQNSISAQLCKQWRLRPQWANHGAGVKHATVCVKVRLSSGEVSCALLYLSVGIMGAAAFAVCQHILYLAAISYLNKMQNTLYCKKKIIMYEAFVLSTVRHFALSSCLQSYIQSFLYFVNFFIFRVGVKRNCVNGS